MDIIKMKIKDIIPYEHNPRKNEQAVDAVAESIKQCGYVAPIIVDENNVILAGHTRRLALIKLGKEEAEVVVRDGLTDEQKRKYRLLDNKTNELASWDFDLLADEIEGLDFGDFDFGFDTVDFTTAQPAEEGEITTVNNTSKEYSEDDFSDDKFECECPRCGFRFNR